MKSVRVVMILAVMAAGALLALQRITLAQSAGADPAAQTVNNLRVLSPVEGQKLTQNFVTVRYEMINPGAAASPTPTFQLQLDAMDPVRTAAKDYTFTGLASGQHTVMVELVDANNTPILGSRRIVHFTVAQAQGGSPGAVNHPAALRPGAEVKPVTFMDSESEGQKKLPATGSALPLLSVIGFGVLLGGIASAMRTR